MPNIPTSVSPQTRVGTALAFRTRALVPGFSVAARIRRTVNVVPGLGLAAAARTGAGRAAHDAVALRVGGVPSGGAALSVEAVVSVGASVDPRATGPAGRNGGELASTIDARISADALVDPDLANLTSTTCCSSNLANVIDTTIPIDAGVDSRAAGSAG